MDMKHCSGSQNKDLVLKLKWHNIAATQLTHVVEGRLKGVMEEANKEKAQKQVAKAMLNEKVLELATVERRAAFAKKAWELAERKAKDLQGKLGEAEIKLAEVASIVSTCDKELVDLKETMKTCEQVFYNMGFKDIENLVGVVVFQA
ncbi:uncharacterized protein LOC136070483 [Quercus suber]|uniref:uncharacterized protein LOC136070483 n=1 Tax=Quercus suber TaxID=58331 RepID=UPI000D2D2DE0|nr:hypothetical protein CFP56_36790 [Quercus suber]